MKPRTFARRPVDTKFQKALALQRANQVQDAEQIYRAILSKTPRHFDAAHMLGVALRQQGRLPESRRWLDLAVSLNPRSASAYSNRGNVLLDLGCAEEALQSFAQSIRLDPDFADAHCNRGCVLEVLNRPDEALAAFQDAIRCAPNHHDAIAASGNVLNRMKRHDEALAAYLAALKLIPGRAATLSNMGALLMDMGRLAEAGQALNAAIIAAPQFASAHNNRANLYTTLKRPEQALVDIEQALKLNPEFAEAWMNRGNVLQDLRRLPEAIASYDRSLALSPGSAACINNKGNALRELLLYGPALAHYDEAIRLSPHYAEAHYHRAIVLQDMQRYEASEAAYAHTVRLKEDHPMLFGEWISSRMMICSWDGLPEQVERLAAKLRAGKPASTSFATLSSDLPADLVRRCATAYIAEKFPDCSQSYVWPLAHANKRIRVGYFSSDFRQHAVSQLAVGVFEHHDQDRFELIGFNLSTLPPDDMTQRVERAFGQLIQIEALSTREIVDTVRAMKLDIAVDLNGHTKGAKLDIFAHRIAPIQVNYLGYPGTSGAPYFDYILADPVIIPPEHFVHYSEKVVHLPHSYLPNDATLEIGLNVPSRAEAGLPDNGFVFCCFNNSYKINAETFDVWMRLLAQVPGSVLWLSAFNETAMRNLRSRAEAAGISEGRLIFAPRAKKLADHLARLSLAELFLDTLPYNAHTTAADALWSGVPVLTCLGNAFPGRVAASLLRAVGLPELITVTRSDYEQLALRLATDAAVLDSLRERLAANRCSWPLFDTARLTRDIEDVYQRMWSRFRDGQPTEHISACTPGSTTGTPM